VFGTPYGSLPELIPAEVGVLSTSKSTLAEGLKNVDSFSKKLCHEYCADNFNIAKMANDYLRLYEIVSGGGRLNNVAPCLPDPNQPKYLPWGE
jgi:hypothetical protein